MKINRKTKNFHHNIFILCLILIVPVFLFKEYFFVRAKKRGRVCPVEDFCQIDPKPIEERSFIFIVLTKNNVESIHLNFHSICRQRYLNYRVIYIDRGSTDGTLSSIRSFVKHSPTRIALVVCERDDEVYQKYREIVGGSPEGEVVIHLCGSDWLAHREVLSNLNQCYANHNVWLTYGHYLDDLDHKGRASSCRKFKGLFYKKGASHKVSWVAAPFKSFYSDLLRGVLIDSTCSLPVRDDRSFLSPIAKMGKAHIGFIPDSVICHDKGKLRQ